MLLYSVAVLTHVARMGSIGVRCMFGTKVEEEIPADYAWRDSRPRIGDSLLSIGPFEIREGSYSDYIRALRGLSGQVGETIEVRWRDQAYGAESARPLVRVQYPPSWTYYRSCVWFLQELLIFAIGARVFWKRPDDDSAQLFFAVCIVTVGAFMGGYHWTEIVTEPLLIYPFALFAVFVPVVNLHFFLVFPRANPILAAAPAVGLGRTLRDSDGLPAGALGKHVRGPLAGAATRTTRRRPPRFRSCAGSPWAISPWRCFSSGLCILCLVYSYRNAGTRAERNQVQWILLASLISLVLIAYLLAQAWIDPATLGRGNAAWPMFGVSLLYTMAYAFSITRYKLMQVEEIINRSAVYFAFSLTAGLIYSGVLLVSGKLIGDQLFSTHSTSRGAVAAALSVIVVLILSEVARGRFQRVIDRQFFREKYKFDRAMQKMRLAVGSLIDRVTLGRRLLEAAAEVLRLEWGALYLGDAPGRPLQLVASHGPAPDERVACRRQSPGRSGCGRRPPSGFPTPWRMNGASDPATDAMIALGGEAATALGDDGHLSGPLVLGPKRSGMPYEDEEMAFLAALELGRHAGASLGRHPADAGEPEPASCATRSRRSPSSNGGS